MEPDEVVVREVKVQRGAKVLHLLAELPNEFFKQIYRLHGWEYREGSLKGPRYVGKLVNALVYEQLPQGVLPELRRRNPPDETGHRRHKHHQFLTDDTGEPHLDKQITAVTTLMRVADNKDQFFKLFQKAFPKPGQARQLRLFPEPDEA